MKKSRPPGGGVLQASEVTRTLLWGGREPARTTSSSLSSASSSGGSRAPAAAMGPPTANPEEPRRCCFGMFVVQSACISLMVFELLLLSHSLIFTATNLATGPEKYAASNSSLSQGLSFEYLTPLLVVQVLWVVTDLLAILALKIALHYLMIPYLVLSLVAVLAASGLIAKFFVGISHLPFGHQIEWPLILAITLLACFIILEAYFLSVKLVCFRTLMRKRKAVQASDDSCRKAADKEDQWSSYSRRSTVVVNDDYLDIPV